MAKLSAKELKAWEASRDLVAELEQSVREMKAGKGRPRPVKVSEVMEARQRTGLSRQQLAGVLGVSARTLEGWEQGRRKPTGAARSLLTIAMRRPDVLRELFGGAGAGA
jgi:putative transcriptional regulator